MHRHTGVDDLSPLSGLANLRKLKCSGSLVAELSPLATLVNLRYLLCSQTQIDDLSPLTALINLESLDCSFTHVADLSPISTLIMQDIRVIWKIVFFDYFEGKLIHVQDCPLICPPVEIARNSPQSVRDYFEELGEKGRRLNEVKVIFLGEARQEKPRW